MDSTKLNTLISKIGRNTAAMREDIQNALIGCAWHAIKHGNKDPILRLFNAVGNVANKAAMAHWLTFADETGKILPIFFKNEVAMIATGKQKEMQEISQDDYASLIAKIPAWDTFAKKTNAAKDFEPEAFIASVAKYLQGCAKKARSHDAAMAKLMEELELSLLVKASQYKTIEVGYVPGMGSTAVTSL